MNNKGFAITSIIYGLMLLFVMVVASFLSVLVGRNRRMDDLMEGIYESLKYNVYEINYDSASNYFYSDKDNNSTFNNVVDEDGDGILDSNSEALNLNPGAYITTQRGKYIFKFNDGSSCTAYLPKNVVVISNSLINDEVGTDLYYSMGGSDSGNLDKFNNKINCINN